MHSRTQKYVKYGRQLRNIISKITAGSQLDEPYRHNIGVAQAPRAPRSRHLW